MEKKIAIAQIPNLYFGKQVVANLPKPQTWMSTKLADATKATIQLEAVANSSADPRLPALKDQILEALNSKLY